jgi:hypothetical protein
MRCLPPPCLGHPFLLIQKFLFFWKHTLNVSSWTMPTLPPIKWLLWANVPTTTIIKVGKRMVLPALTPKEKGFTQGQFFGSKRQNFSHTHVDKGVSPTSSQGNNKEEQPTCQICQKHNHTALTYFNRFNHAFTPNDVP